MLTYAIIVASAGVAGGALSALWLFAHRRFGKMPDAQKTAELKKHPYYFGGTFHNDEPVSVSISKKDMSKMFLAFFKADKNLSCAIPVKKLGRESFSEKKDEFSAVWLGHSTIIFEMEGARFITDPVFGNASPLPRSVMRFSPPPLLREDIPPLDFAIISHDHYDHLEYETVRILNARGVRFITALGVGARLKGWGVPESRITELGWEDSVEIGLLTITAERARHFSGRRPKRDRNKTLWASYVIESQTRRLFFGADGGYGAHFAEIGRKYGGFDIVCLEIDAWNERWPNHHMFPEEAVRAFEDLNGKALLPIHWGAYNLAMHPWDESITMLKAAAQKSGVHVVDLQIGEKAVWE